MLSQPCKDLPQVSFVLILIIAINEDIVQIDQNEIVDVTTHNIIHESLERARGVTQAQR